MWRAHHNDPDALPREIWPILAILMIGYFGVGVVLPGLPHHMRDALATGDVGVGAAVGALAIAALLFRLPSGRFCDRVGRRQAARLGLACAVGAGLLYLVPSVPVVLAARALHGITEAFLFTAAAAWMIGVAPPHRRTHALALLGSALWAGLSLGPAFGVLLSSWTAAGIAVIVSSLAGLVLLAFVRGGGPHPSSERAPLLVREGLLPGGALALVNVVYAAMTGFLILHLADHGGQGGLVLAAYGVSIGLARLVTGRLSQRIGPVRGLVLAFSIQVFSIAMIALAPTPSVVLAAAMTLGVGFSMHFPILATVVLGRVGAHARGAAVATMTAFFDAGVAISGFGLGIVAAHLGYAAVFWVSTAAVAGAGVVALTYVRQSGYRLRRAATIAVPS